MALNIDFLSKSKIAIPLSSLLLIFSIYTWLSQGDAKYGVDFKGGHEIILQVEGSSSDQIRDAIKNGGLDNSVVQNFESNSGQYAVRLAGNAEGAKDVIDKLSLALNKDLAGKYTILSNSYVGPTIGAELRRSAVIAIIISLIGMLLYITFRFEFAFALGAVVALFHDVIITLGLVVFSGHQVNMATLAAALTIVGYSVNDTIVIFDRVREEIYKGKFTDLPSLFNHCINVTLSRTLITSLLTWFSALALLVFGGGTIQELSLFLVIGIMVGSYSTIYIASPVAIAWENYKTSKIKQTA